MSSDELNAALPAQLRDMMPDGIPPDFMQMLQPMMGMVQQLGAAAFAMQVGQHALPWDHVPSGRWL